MINTLGLYDTADAAAYCGLSVSGFKHHVQKGHITPGYQKNKITIFTQAELDRFLLEPIDPRGARRVASSAE